MGNFYATINTDPDHDLQQSLPTQIGCDQNGDNPVPLVAHKRLTAEEDQEDCAASMVSNGDYVETEVVQFGMGKNWKESHKWEKFTHHMVTHAP